MKDLKEILISIDDFERRVAILEGGQLVEIYIERVGQPRRVGNIYQGKVRDILPGMGAAFVDIGMERNAFLGAAEIAYEETDFFPSIEKVLKKNQKILVQVVKEPKRGKGARLTSLISLPGRYVVLMPFIDFVGISRRLEEERDKYKEIGERIKPPGMGIIIRTAARDVEEEDIQRDLDDVVRTWEEIKRKAKNLSTPLIHSEFDLPLRAARDFFTHDFRRLLVDSYQYFRRINLYLRGITPSLAERVHLYKDNLPLFEKFRIEEELEKALRREVWLRSGGYLVIDPTEALTSIDVNTGKFTGGKDLEETIYKTNLEAAREIVRQIRLRDIGGIIIIDFIDMKDESHRQEVIRVFNECLLNDRSKSKVTEISALGMVEMTRKSVFENLFEIVGESCPSCGVAGYYLSDQTVSIIVARKIGNFLKRAKDEAYLIKVHTRAVPFLTGRRESILSKIEKDTGKRIFILSDSEIDQLSFEVILSGKREEVEKFFKGA